MGTPTQQTWPEGVKLAAAMNFRFPTFTTTPLSKIVTNASPEAIDLITSMCHWDPNKRPSAVQVGVGVGGGGGVVWVNLDQKVVWFWV
jgi:protein kinase